MNEGQSQSRNPKRVLGIALAAAVPLLGTLALGHAERAFGQDGIFATEPEPAEQPILPSPPVDETDMPDAADDSSAEEIPGGMASWYGAQFAGKRTANGERFDPAQYTAAHRTLPFGSRVRVKSARSGKTVVVRINDRGPFGHGRVIDLSHAAAREIGLVQAGSGRVELALLDR